MMQQFMASARRMPTEPDWHRRAVFYEVLTQACFDSDDDGVGDLLGLVSKLDHLRWLGIDCPWLPPFYGSPRRDGGYDIRDFTTISAAYGGIKDFVTLLDEAHSRGIRVINLSRHPQPVQLPLRQRFHGHIPVELTGDTRFPAIGRRSYLLTLPGYGSYWFRLVTPDRIRSGGRAR